MSNDVDYLYTVSFIGENDVTPYANKFTDKSEMLEHVRNLLKIWDLAHMDYEGMIDEASSCRRIFLTGNNELVVTKIDKMWFAD